MSQASHTIRRSQRCCLVLVERLPPHWDTVSVHDHALERVQLAKHRGVVDGQGDGGRRMRHSDGHTNGRTKQDLIAVVAQNLERVGRRL